MALQKSFIHGNMIMVELNPRPVEDPNSPNIPGKEPTTPENPLMWAYGIPWTDIVGLPQGWGKTYRGKASKAVWFHAAIPTPVMHESVLVRLQDIFVFFTTEAGCFMSDIRVWDGPDSIQEIGNLRVEGDRSRNPVRGQNAFSPRMANGNLHTMNFGLEFSIQITFTREANVVFASAGAAFMVAL